MIILIIILGLLFGSFLNCYIHRSIIETSLMGRSKCPACAHVLSIADLIPVLSYLYLKGKCRYCSAKIAAKYPLTEIYFSLTVLLIYLYFGLSIKFLVYSALSFFLVAIAFTDALTGYIYDRDIISSFLVLALYHLCETGLFYEMIKYPLFIAIIASLIFFTSKLFKKQIIGAGDILFLSLIVFICGIDDFFKVSNITVILMLTYQFYKNKKIFLSGELLPLGPFMFLSLNIFYLFGFLSSY